MWVEVTLFISVVRDCICDHISQLWMSFDASNILVWSFLCVQKRNLIIRKWRIIFIWRSTFHVSQRSCTVILRNTRKHDDIIIWKHFPRYWTFVRGIHRSPVDSPHKASVAEHWWLLWSAPEQTVEQTIGTPVIWDAIAFIMVSL